MYLKLLKEKKQDLLKFYDKPYYAYLSLSNLCNANCVFCDVRENKENNCSIDVFKLIDELSLLGTKYIHFTGGGEPFINDDIFKYIEYATKKGIHINVISNGLNLDEEKIKKIATYDINAVFFSIDSFNAEI
ncbi:radical SAM protein, partial [bacterium]|nr:radical SAM protein [bacterium]